ncbi:MAG: hypothetical protein Q9162_001529 [Coniocarpon cinnabarinum]
MASKRRLEDVDESSNKIVHYESTKVYSLVNVASRDDMLGFHMTLGDLKSSSRVITTVVDGTAFKTVEETVVRAVTESNDASATSAKADAQGYHDQGCVMDATPQPLGYDLHQVIIGVLNGIPQFKQLVDEHPLSNCDEDVCLICKFGKSSSKATMNGQKYASKQPERNYPGTSSSLNKVLASFGTTDPVEIIHRVLGLVNHQSTIFNSNPNCINQTFGMEYEQLWWCKKCGSATSSGVQRSYVLTLHAPRGVGKNMTLQDRWHYTFLADQEKRCGKCRMKCLHSRRVELLKAPEVLLMTWAETSMASSIPPSFHHEEDREKEVVNHFELPGSTSTTRRTYLLDVFLCEEESTIGTDTGFSILRTGLRSKTPTLKEDSFQQGTQIHLGVYFDTKESETTNHGA